MVKGPGKTVAVAQQVVRAPFAGTLTSLRVADGDSVRRGQVLGTIVARDAAAALSGAREMVRQASRPGARRDAARALALAEKDLVQAPLTAPADGRILAHAAASGDRVSEDQDLLTIADAGALVFLADIAQSDLSRVQAGQPAQVALSGAPAPLAGTVRAVLPAANPADFTGPVRIDLGGAGGRLTVGLFGAAAITVGARQNVPAVPDAAILRDDVSGVTQVAVVTQGHAHWTIVKPGLAENGRTEIVAPPLAPGTQVIVAGQVGLPDGKAVAIQP